MFSRFLSLMVLSCCVCGLELNVDHSSYQAEEKQSVTLVWTFTPRPDPSFEGLFIYCDVFTEGKPSALLHLQEGVEIPLDKEEFSGRVQFDKNVLREGRIRLHVSSLRTEDTGWYTCDVRTDSGVRSDSCHLNVNAARDQTHSTTGPEEPDPERLEKIILYCGMGLGTTAAVGLFVFYFKVVHPRL